MIALFVKLLENIYPRTLSAQIENTLVAVSTRLMGGYFSVRGI